MLARAFVDFCDSVVRVMQQSSWQWARLHRLHQLHVAVQDVQVERQRERDRERQQDRHAAAQLTAHLGDAQTENGRLTQLVASLQQAEEEVRQAEVAHAVAAEFWFFGLYIASKSPSIERWDRVFKQRESPHLQQDIGRSMPAERVKNSHTRAQSHFQIARAYKNERSRHSHAYECGDE